MVGPWSSKISREAVCLLSNAISNAVDVNGGDTRDEDLEPQNRGGGGTGKKGMSGKETRPTDMCGAHDIYMTHECNPRWPGDVGAPPMAAL